MKLKKLLLSFLTIALLITLAIPSSLAIAEELPTSFSETLQTTVSTSEINSEVSVKHGQLAQSLGVTIRSYDELKSDPNAPKNCITTSNIPQKTIIQLFLQIHKSIKPLQ
ncbi:hypothetical protein [Paenibacillus assamensis]|uniref:hypothetical protein n=1 Tax=Paenibacillus assamensis TaxID=311244 RepID=UPI0004909D75|nr:hypothetical protein [Paenibacillus assamensis]